MLLDVCVVPAAFTSPTAVPSSGVLVATPEYSEMMIPRESALANVAVTVGVPEAVLAKKLVETDWLLVASFVLLTVAVHEPLTESENDAAPEPTPHVHDAVRRFVAVTAEPYAFATVVPAPGAGMLFADLT